MADPKFQTSFIPKKAMVEPKPQGGGIGVFLFVSIIIFFIAVGFAAFVYLDKQLLINQINENKKIISQNQDSFDVKTIENIIELNSRIVAANSLLDNHVSVSPIFDLINRGTLVNVRFKDFTFSGSADQNGQKIIKIQMNGIAKDFETVALQADYFGSDLFRNKIKGVSISNLGNDDSGGVTFLMSATVLPDTINYEKAVSSRNI